MRTTDNHDGSGVSGRTRVAQHDTQGLDPGRLRRIAALATDTSASDGERAVAAASGHAPADRDRVRDVEERGDDPRASADHPPPYEWLLVVPFAATLVGTAVGALFGFGVFDPGPPGDVSLLPYLVLVPYFLAGLAGTLWLVEDASRLAATDADWQPNPWLYVFSGALVLEAVVAAPVVRGEITTDVVPYLAGGFVLAALLSSVV
ncbi:MAG: hypothetical protein ABEH83_13015, partial [Halobacterium sp.]